MADYLGSARLPPRNDSRRQHGGGWPTRGWRSRRLAYSTGSEPVHLKANRTRSRTPGCGLLALSRHGARDPSTGVRQHPVEKGKAIARVAAVAIKRTDQKTLETLVPLVKPLLNGFEPRSQARLIHVLWLAGDRAEALALAEQEIATGHASRPMADPRDRA